MVKGSLVLAILLSPFALACSVTPAGQDLWTTGSGTTPSPSPTPAPSPTPLPAPCAEDVGCGPSETSYETITQCTSAGHDRCRLVRVECGADSFYCGSGGVQCDAAPACDSGDTQVVLCSSADDCY